MELGLFVEPQIGGTYDDLVRLATWAEDRGLDVFARSDHYLDGLESEPATDALATLAGLARDTERIQLAVLVAPLTFRHPAVMAKTAVTIDQMSRGRLAFGVGTGWMESEHEEFGLDLPPMKERFERLFEALAYLRAALGEGATGFSGRHYRLGSIDVLPKPAHLPLIVGGTGPTRTPTLAGRFADEYNSFVGGAGTLPDRLDVMRRAAAEAGRDPGDIKVSLAGSVVVGRDHAEYQEALAAGAAAREMTAGEYEAFLAGRHVPRGTPDRAAEIINAFADQGVDRFYLQQYMALPDIDTDLIGLVFDAVRS
jgi:alkanesulfonate monooxygenase SsuD/methylene tetrahydromethanopterin reductase-like flavin-dependent oxidoreductase (luciferase family)